MALSSQWIRTVDDAIHNTAWDAYDEVIYNEIGPTDGSIEGSYNARFLGSTGYRALDWKWVKAMVWVESGGPKGPKSAVAWRTRPMQIGDRRDAGYTAIKKCMEQIAERQKRHPIKTSVDCSEVSLLIMPPGLCHAIQSPGSINEPKLNIRAGIAYLFTRMADFGKKYVRDPHDPGPHTGRLGEDHEGEGLLAFAKRVDSTLENVRANLGHVREGSIGRYTELKYYKVTWECCITGWKKWDYKTIHERYNSENPKIGDPTYPEKLQYVIEKVLPKLERE